MAGMMMSDLQLDQLSKECAEKAAELEHIKEELDKCENQRLDLSERLTILSADKNIADADLKASHKQAALQKKELEVLVVTNCRNSFLSFLYHILQLLACCSRTPDNGRHGSLQL